MKVQRYKFGEELGMLPDDNGHWVSIQDYKELLEKYNDLLNDDCGDCGCPEEVCKMIPGKCKNLAYR